MWYKSTIKAGMKEKRNKLPCKILKIKMFKINKGTDVSIV